MGKDLATLLTALRQWGDRWIYGEGNEPRNVTPPEVKVYPPDDSGGAASSSPREQARDDTPEWQTWTWNERGRGFPWLGVLLVLLGVGLLIRYLVPAISVGTLILLALGLAFIASWLIGRSWFAMVPGSLLLALGITELLEDLALFGPAGEDVPGLGSAALAIAFVVIWLGAMARGRRWNLALWGAALFGLLAAVQLSGRIIGLPQLEALWPVVIIIIGVVLLMNARRR